ncbi:sulfatase-like hydrolase/transferase [Shewanella atlantica]|uniref:DUF229 domain-containing protein n=1 Tax=Shewanella atlantica TaxID=271099 RepID=A0A3S0KLR7_9GAMM|nr:sulfatase-like hydrolase/transferase [Shewanella atlantica]RTR33357.1 DUF229 domain-containing protein [Shewanella atlantica]
MTEENNKEINQPSQRRTFWRTVAMMLLFLIFIFNYRQLLLSYPLFSVISFMNERSIGEMFTTELATDLLLFTVVTIVLHVFWALVITISCKPLFDKFKNQTIQSQIWFVIVLLHFTLVLAANAYWYPTSLVGFLRTTPLASTFGLTVLSSVIFALFSWGLYVQLGKVVTVMSFSIISLAALFANFTPNTTYQPENPDIPNIFIIGIDGLRPDQLSYRSANPRLTPNINKFLSGSLIYDNTYTPQARTYVAWMSILTGQYPVKHGGRFNLTPPELIQKPFPLVRELNEKGYKTLYAMDERRFNQLDKEYGFDQVIGPKIGAAGLIITKVADIPLINILVNTPISDLLFPYLYINRAYGKTYSPEHFNREVMTQLSIDKPNFLAVHFCQLHWPYTSKDFIDVENTKWDGNYNHFMYQAMLKKVDEQFGNFIKNLESKGYMENAIVYLISDHGESFLLDKDRLTSDKYFDDSEFVNDAWGHGTNVLSQEQSNVLMAYRRYQETDKKEIQQVVKGTFSLVDIAPSLLNELGVAFDQNHQDFDGFALKSDPSNFANRGVFVESPHPVKAINTSFIAQNELMSETSADYDLRQNGRVVIKPDIYKELIAKKQRSIYLNQWQLAMLPNQNKLIVVDTKENTWNYLPDYEGGAPVTSMLTQLCNHYRGDEGFDNNHCSELAKR